MRLLIRQQEIVDQYSIVADVQERLTLVMERARRRPAWPEAERTEAARVQGCVSRVWLRGVLKDGRCVFSVDGDSALVRGLASLLCEVYEGATPAEVVAVEPELLERLGIAQNLSPTRQHGLKQVRRAIREFALAAQREVGA